MPAYGKLVVGKLDPEESEQVLRGWGHRVVERARMKIEQEIAPEISNKGPYVFMYNHQSLLDIPILYTTAPCPGIRMVAKSELFAVPFWGKTLKAVGTIEINRKNRKQAINSLKIAGQRIREGTSVLIAPEGTRTSTGELLPLKKGGFHLAKEAGVDIVPVAISGAYKVLANHQARMAYDVPIKIVYGKPIPTKDATVLELLNAVEDFYRENVDIEMNA